MGAFLDAFTAGDFRNEGATHAAGDDAGEGDEDGGGENDPAGPFDVREEYEDVDEEGEEGEEEGWDAEDYESEEVARGVAGSLKVGEG